MIRQCYAVSGDWFVVSKPGGEGRWFIGRVTLWALVEADGEISHVRALDETGIPHEDEQGDSYFAYGPDTSPAGCTWKELYDRTVPNVMNVREITDSMQAKG